MISRVLLVCLFLGVCSGVSTLSCRWLDHKFKVFSENSLKLFQSLTNNSTNTTEDAALEETVAFPDDLYSQADKDSAEVKLGFTAQVLEEMVDLLHEDHSATSWEERTLKNFFNLVSQQINHLRSCIGEHSHKKKNKKLQLYFKRLSCHILERQGHSAEAWELVRTEMEYHLTRADLLVSSLLD
ncbi:interferon a3-like [Cynoglossus semilaevis]|uniref:Interferon phi 4 n=1 Tax=Cynoglossus semilaevis TaxID=244447 RepID=A0A3P8VCW5_CYNSE|nr:interferon a3-like [Cynoglossus semilaevis]